jgi:sterol desaturase/sphingolipid hydroxylase (fatty acid hydroxylase superfamily)
VIEFSDAGNAGERSGYRPAPIQMGPLYRWPPQPVALFKWLFGVPGYFLPWQILFILVAWLSSRLLTPDAQALKSLSAGVIARIFVANLALLVVFVTPWHLWLYVKRAQGTSYKYNSRWLSVGDRRFLFGRQLWDNVFWTLCSAVPIWTAYEALTLSLQANRFLPTIRWGAHPVYCTMLVLLIPVWLNIHFYAFHRLIHWEPLYKSVHSLHHKNINVGPWSGLAMHPIEHLVYFSAVIIFWVIPAHPFHTVYLLQSLAFGPVLEHHGFDRLVLNRKTTFNTDHYIHYLHHKYVKVNFSTDTGLLPLDKWLGTFHDGSDEAHEAWKKRMREQALRSRRC